MSSTLNASGLEPAGNETKGGFGGLVAILVAIVLGGLVGVFYGRTMWMAAGGPQRAQDKLEKTKEQKNEFALNADRQADEAQEGGQHEQAEKYRAQARRLRSHVPKIEAEIDRVGDTIARHREKMGLGEDNEKPDRAYVRTMRVADLVWQFTKFFGDLFLQVLCMLVIPLVVTSMICGIASLGDVRKMGRMGGWTIGYYFITCGIAVLVGIFLVQVIEPGKGADDTFSYVTESVQQKEGTGVLETLLDVFRGKDYRRARSEKQADGMFPQNLFLAASNTNVLALIAFAIVFGGALTTLGEKGKVAIDFFIAANEAVMKMVHLVMFFAPVGIYGLVASKIAENGGGEAFGEEIRRLGWYAATVLVGLSIHVVVLGLLLPLLARRNPFAYTYNMLRSLLTAMSTASSSATLPVTMECVEKKNNVTNRSASFVLPLGATINMDGTALYEAVAVIFIAQSIGMPLSTAHLVIVFLTATLAAVGAAGIPEAGLVTMVIVLNAAGVPTSGIGTILAIDWFLDRMRTTVNVYGDSVGAAVVDRIVVTKPG